MVKSRKIIATLAILLVLSGCGMPLGGTQEEALLGKWRMEDVDMTADMHEVYPEGSVLEFSEDGTWNSDPESIWVVTDGNLTLDASFLLFPHTYKIKISGDTMILQFSDLPAITFHRENQGGAEETASGDVS